MAETEFTQGEWWQARPGYSDLWYVSMTDPSRAQERPAPDEDPTEHSDMMCVFMPRRDRRANAHLIAAAPDLYAAVQAYLDRYCSGEVRSYDDAEQIIAVHKQIVSAMQAAVAKARGES